MSQCYSIIIDRGISAPGHDKEVVDEINAVDKPQFPGSKIFNAQIQIHASTQKYDVSLAK